MKDEDFVTKTINEGNVDIQKFPTSKVQQLAKKMESSKQHKFILCITSVQYFQPEITINRKGNKTKATKPQAHRAPNSMKPFDMRNMNKQSDRCIRCGDTIHAKGFQCPAKKIQYKVCHKFGHFTTVCYQKNQHTPSSFSLRNLRHTNYEQGPYTLIKMVIAMYLKNQILMNCSVYR